jgi:hypothetical protein
MRKQSSVQIVSYVSRPITLKAGEVILGYPKDKQVWLKAGTKSRAAWRNGAN